MANNGNGTALITGASTGIGAVYADRLAKQGYDLILVARNEQRLGKLAAGLRKQTGRRVEVLKVDLTVPAELQRVEDVLRTDSSITVLVNNAGFGASSNLLESNVDDMENMIYLNVTALTRLTHAAARPFVDRKNGLIINIASIVALAPELLNGTYSGTKAYVVNLTQSLNRELAESGVRVQAVLPGAIETPFWDRAGLPVTHLPSEIVMSAEELVDASLSGLRLGEVITIPSLPDVADWQAMEKARLALAPNLSHQHSAARYAVAD
jgi:short-subunit dehydrogenase